MRHSKFSLCTTTALWLGLLLTQLLATSEAADDPDRQCLPHRNGLSACNFDFDQNPFCGWEHPDATPWKRTKQDTPLEPRKKYYIYLNGKDYGGQSARMESQLAKNVKSLCGDFYYATSEGAETSITFSLWDDGEYQLMHKIEANTNGTWVSSNFVCCLPTKNLGKMQISLETTAPPGGFVGFDIVDLRLSNMTCTGDELVCYPTPPAPPTTTTTAPTNTTDVVYNNTTTTDIAPTTATTERTVVDTTTPTWAASCSGSEEKGLASCEFNEDLASPNTSCGWSVPESWNQSLSSNGRGGYIFYTGGQDSLILANVSETVEAVCVEIQFAPETDSEPLEDAFSLFIADDQDTYLWGEAYNYAGSRDKGWRRNSFVGCISPGANRQMMLIARREGLKIDYIHVRSTDKSCAPPATPASPEQGPKTIFSCPSEGVREPFCGFNTSGDGWNEVTNSNGSDFFKGKDNYIEFQGDSADLEKPATLSTELFETDRESTITFSYNMIGPADVEIVVEAADGSIRELVWSTRKETARQWSSITKTISTTGTFKVIIEVARTDAIITEPIALGFTGISIAESAAATGGKGNDNKGKDKDKDNTSKDTVKPDSIHDGGSYTPVIVGSVVACVVVLALVAGGVFYWRKRSRSTPAGGRYVYNAKADDDESSLSSPRMIENAMYSS